MRIESSGNSSCWLVSVLINYMTTLKWMVVIALEISIMKIGKGG